jgi:hypothetical protein
MLSHKVLASLLHLKSISECRRQSLNINLFSIRVNGPARPRKIRANVVVLIQRVRSETHVSEHPDIFQQDFGERFPFMLDYNPWLSPNFGRKLEGFIIKESLVFKRIQKTIIPKAIRNVQDPKCRGEVRPRSSFFSNTIDENRIRAIVGCRTP